MKLFETLEDLKPFIFRIMDNGGATADRFTIVTCDGDYFAYSTDPCAPQGVGLTGEGIDPQVEMGRITKRRPEIGSCDDLASVIGEHLESKDVANVVSDANPMTTVLAGVRGKV